MDVYEAVTDALEKTKAISNPEVRLRRIAQLILRLADGDPRWNLEEKKAEKEAEKERARAAAALRSAR